MMACFSSGVDGSMVVTMNKGGGRYFNASGMSREAMISSRC
jgi:arabinogalactan endo-1,4-beta-galactosidase